MNIKCMYYDKQYSNKPVGLEIGNIQKKLIGTEIDIKELAETISKGATFKPALLSGTKSVDFVSQQIFGLDFDENTTIQDEFDRCAEINIKPVFVYTTFSHTQENHKFRMVFCTDKVITDINERNKIQNSLMLAFPNVDIKCKDISRLFFGGRQLVLNDYEQRVDIKLLTDTYKVINTIKSNKYNNKPKNVAIKQQSTNYNSYDESLIKSKTDAISTLNVVVARGLIGLRETYTNSKNNSYISVGKSQTAESIESATVVGCRGQLFDLINELDLNEYLGIPEGTLVRCILPDHEDDNASANVFTMSNGTKMYKCFGCNTARTIIGITEELAQCTRSKAIAFIQEVYNIKVIESDWVQEQKQLMIDSANYLSTDEFTQQFPELSKMIRTRKSHIKEMLFYMSQHISDDMKVDGKPIFFASYDTLINICEINKRDDRNCRNKLSQTLIIFYLLNMLMKVEPDKIPQLELKKAQAIAIKYGHQKLTNFYQFEEYGILSLKGSEKKAIILKENNMTLAGLSREYVYRTFGQEEADRCFPQYKYQNALGTSQKSDKATIKIAKKIAKKIEKQGYCLESDLRKNKSDELQWKKSINDILNGYGWIRIRANNELKQKYNLGTTGYPFIIVEEN